jgi:uncharacterized protein
MDKDAEGPPLSRKLRITDIDETVEHRIEATPDEMADIVALLDLLGLEGLTVDYRLRHGAGGRIHLAGRLKARATQTCVVSLDPVDAAIDAPMEVEFWPVPLVEELERKAEDPGHAGLLDWPETIADGMIDLGPVIYESLATALDPYPKQAGASFQWSQGAETAEGGESGPFAALKRLKDR